MTRRPNKRNVKRELNKLDPTEGDGYGGIWCRSNHVGDPEDPGDVAVGFIPFAVVAPDDLVVEINHAIVPPADDAGDNEDDETEQDTDDGN